MPPPPLPKGYEQYRPAVGAGGHIPGTPWTKDEERAAYGEPAPRSWLDEAKSFAEGLVVDTAKGVAHSAQRSMSALNPNTYTDPNVPIQDKLLNVILGPAGPLVADAVKAHIETAKKAKGAIDRGSPVEAAGAALATAIPVVGPMAAGIGDLQTNEDGTLAPGAVARAAGQTAALLAPEALRAAQPMAAPAAEMLRESGQREYAQVLGATTKGNKLRSERVVPELIDRGVTSTTLKGLSEKANTAAAGAGQAITDAFDNLPTGSRVGLGPISAALEKGARDAFTVENPQTGARVPMSGEASRGLGHIAEINKALEQIAEVDPATGEMYLSAANARRVRQFYDQVTKDAGGFEGKNLSDKSIAGAHEMAADAIREQLSSNFPDIAKMNKEYSFWKDVARVVDDTMVRKQGQAKGLGKKIAGAAGAAGGFGSGGLAGAIVGKVALESLESMVSSPAWRTISAVTKDRLADALSKGNRGAAEHYIRVARGAVMAQEARMKAGGSKAAQNDAKKEEQEARGPKE